MNTLIFNVVPEEEKNLTTEQADKIMNDVQNLLTHVGMYIVTAEMGLQGRTPEEFRSKFNLSHDPIEREEENSILNAALSMLENTLDVASSEIINRWLSEKYTDPRYKVAIAKDLMALCDNLEGCKFSYGRRRILKELYNTQSERFIESVNADTKTITCTLAGVICRNPDTKGRNAYYLDTGSNFYKITTGKEFNETTAEKYSKAGACLLSGFAVLDENDDIVEIRDIYNIDNFPGIVFKRIITPVRDLALLNSIAADVSFDRKSRKWILKNEILGISRSKPNWNDAVIEFHDYFIFLWETYVDQTKEGLGEEEIEIRDYLLSMIPY
ncbi:MAG TPA: hypothetical protein VJY42_03170 [Candidatus Methanomethylophilaceae archaeon]|nr:hypothetical protein [Candidatus Methanomethylophilaceae archaeon]